MKVLVISEDYTRDQHMLEPILTAMLQAAGKPKATVQVCQSPRFRGVSQVLDWSRLAPVIERYKGMTDLFLICVDRDGDTNRRAALNHLEAQAEKIAPGCIILAENAWQEIEVWVLAGHDLPRDWKWNEVRQEVNPKEIYYQPFARRRGVHLQPAQGRRILAEEAAQRYPRIRRRCPEDIADLEKRITQRLKQP